MLRKGASLKRRRDGAFVNGPRQHIQIQPGSVPVLNSANELEPAWIGKQGPLIYRTSSFISDTGANPKQCTNSFVKSGIKKVRINSVQFMVSYYKLRTDQQINYSVTTTVSGTNHYSITIPKGNYSKRELQTYFKRELHQGRLQFYTNAANQTVFYVIPATGDGTITALVISALPDDIKNALGFRTQALPLVGALSQTISKTNGSAVTGSTITSVEHINLSLPNTIHICSPRLHAIMRSRSVDMSTDGTQNAFIATIPVYVNSGQFVHWNNSNAEFYDAYGTGELLFDDVAFCYSDGSKVDFNGAPWMIEVGYMMDDAGPQARDLTSSASVETT